MVSSSFTKKEVDRTFARIEKKKRKHWASNIKTIYRLTKRLDDRIYINKYYPWCYKNYIPTLALQGWYNRSEAKKLYKLFYGPNALKHVRFIKGKKAIEKNFSIGKTVYIDGMWRQVKNKLFFSTDHLCYKGTRMKERIASDKLVVSTGAVGKKKREKIIVKQVEIKLLGNAQGGVIPTIGNKKKLGVSKVQKAFQKRKDYLYEE